MFPVDFHGLPHSERPTLQDQVLEGLSPLCSDDLISCAGAIWPRRTPRRPSSLATERTRLNAREEAFPSGVVQSLVLAGGRSSCGLRAGLFPEPFQLEARLTLFSEHLAAECMPRRAVSTTGWETVSRTPVLLARCAAGGVHRAESFHFIAAYAHLAAPPGLLFTYDQKELQTVFLVFPF